MRILVTGGAGFIGSHIVDRLLAHGHEVTVVDNLSTGRSTNLPKGIALHRVSILNKRLEQLCQGIDVVVHAAAQTSVAASVAGPLADAEANVLGTIHTATAAIRTGVRRLIYLSSAAVYGAPLRLPIAESHPTSPSSPYGLSKWAGEQYIRLIAAESGMAWFSLRLANVYGPRQSAHGEAGVVARWCAALAGGEPLDLHGDGEQTRDFIYVEDVAQAVAHTVTSSDYHENIMNIGTGRQTSLRELLATLEDVTGRPSVISPAPERVGDIRHSVLDAAVARHALRWQPDCSLRDGLALTVRDASIRKRSMR